MLGSHKARNTISACGDPFRSCGRLPAKILRETKPRGPPNPNPKRRPVPSEQGANGTTSRCDSKRLSLSFFQGVRSLHSHQAPSNAACACETLCSCENTVPLLEDARGPCTLDVPLTMSPLAANVSTQARLKAAQRFLTKAAQGPRPSGAPWLTVPCTSRGPWPLSFCRRRRRPFAPPLRLLRSCARGWP